MSKEYAFTIDKVWREETRGDAKAGMIKVEKIRSGREQQCRMETEGNECQTKMNVVLHCASTSRRLISIEKWNSVFLDARLSKHTKAPVTALGCW